MTVTELQIDSRTAHCYGVWEVWNGEAPPDDISDEEREEEYRHIGVFKGYIDDIALRLGQEYKQDWHPFSFRRAPAGAVYEELAAEAPMAEVCLVDVELTSGDWVSGQPGDIAKFFAGRPVTADYHPKLDSIRLTSSASSLGEAIAARKAALEGILNKLTEPEIQTLVNHGLLRYTY